MGKNLSAKEKSMAQISKAVNRKQIPVCKACHVDIHAGKYDGISLSTILNNKKSLRKE